MKFRVSPVSLFKIRTSIICNLWKRGNNVPYFQQQLHLFTQYVSCRAGRYSIFTCVFGAKNRIIHLLAICVFSLFFIFFEWQLARARFFVPTGVCKALFRDSASVLNAFWPARIVVACFGVFQGEIFYGCQPMIFPGFFWRRLARPRFVYQLASGKPCSWLWLGFRMRSGSVGGL